MRLNYKKTASLRFIKDIISKEQNKKITYTYTITYFHYYIDIPFIYKEWF